MTISMSNIPANILRPLFYAQVDNSKANTASQPQRTLLIGQKLAAGSTQPNVAVRCQSLADAKYLTGAGSMLAAMTAAYLANDPSADLWLLPLSDDGSAVAASGSIAFTGPSTANGTLSLYLAGTLLSVPIASGSTAAQIATAVAAAITAAPDLLFSAAVDGGVNTKVDLTAKNKGLAGNDLDVQVDFHGAAGGEYVPAGVTYTIVPMSGGTINPTLTTALANLGESPFDFIVSAYTDSTSVTAISALLNDSTGRWSPTSLIYGHCLIAYRQSMGGAAAYVAALNDQHLTVVPFQAIPQPNFVVAAAFFGAAAASLRNDPGLPLQTVAVAGLLPPPTPSRYLSTQREALLHEGGSTFTVGGGNVLIENMTTTYQTNTLGAPDNSYLEIETMFLLMFILRDMRDMVSTKYGRKKLAANGTRLLPGSNVVTCDIIRADIIARYRMREAQGYVQQSDVFAAGIVVEQNASNPNRVDVLYPAVLIDQIRVFALLAQFRQ